VLEQAGVSFIVIDEPRPFTASKAAAGLINPVTGRRIVTTWMIDELLPFALEAYWQMGETLGMLYMTPTTLVDFFPTAQMRLAFLKRHGEDPAYLELPPDEHTYDEFFRYELGLWGDQSLLPGESPGTLGGQPQKNAGAGGIVGRKVRQGRPDRGRRTGPLPGYQCRAGDFLRWH